LKVKRTKLTTKIALNVMYEIRDLPCMKKHASGLCALKSPKN